MKHKNIQIEDSKNNQYMPTLDGIRGIACLLVVVSHINYFLTDYPFKFQFGELGVVIFFSLSGFLMSTLYLSHNLNTDSVANYCISRISRILPAYYIAIILAFLIYQIYPEFYFQMTPMMTLRSFAFLGSAGVFWSIPPEVQFYGFFITIWAAYQFFINKKILWPSFAIAGIIVFCFISQSYWPGITLPVFMHVFILGVIMGRLNNINKIAVVTNNVFFQIAIFMALIIYMSLYAMPETLKDLPLIMLLSLNILSLSKTTFFTKILTLSLIRLIGAASFSIYLLHLHIVFLLEKELFNDSYNNVIEVAFVFVICVGLPIIFYKCIEKPLTAKTKKMMLDGYKYFQKT